VVVVTQRDARGRFVKAPTPPTLEEVRQWIIEDYARPNEAVLAAIEREKERMTWFDLRSGNHPAVLKIGDKVTIKLPAAPFSVSPPKPWWRRLHEWLGGSR
jgi:hypothetical protein